MGESVEPCRENHHEIEIEADEDFINEFVGLPLGLFEINQIPPARNKEVSEIVRNSWLGCVLFLREGWDYRSDEVLVLAFDAVNALARADKPMQVIDYVRNYVSQEGRPNPFTRLTFLRNSGILIDESH